MRNATLGFATAILVAGCGIADFDVDQDIREQRIEGSGLPGPVGGVVDLPLDLDLAGAIESRDTGPIDGVTLAALTLDITRTEMPDGDADDWSFLAGVDVFISSTRDGSSLPRRRIAHVDQPGATASLDFEVDDVNLKPYVDEGASITSTASGNVPADDISFDGEAVFTIHPI